MAEELDALNKRILNYIQNDFPLVDRPFAKMAEMFRATEDDIFARVKMLREQKFIRQISAIFDSRGLGYVSSLVAARYDPAMLQESAKIINGHPGVSHNYKRNHEFNMWYTITLPPTSKFGLRDSVRMLHNISGAQSTLLLPTIKLYKIGVNMDVAGEGSPTDLADIVFSDKNREKADKLVTDWDIKLILELQKDLPSSLEPYREWADNLGITTAQLYDEAARFIKKQQMRRFSAVLYHRKVGFTANGMGVWKVPPERVEELGPVMAGFRAVSHSYQRPVYPDWPYPLFTMVHGKTHEECEQVLGAISEKTGIKEYAVLYSVLEYKKIRVKYFTPENDAWETDHQKDYEALPPAAGLKPASPVSSL